MQQPATARLPALGSVDLERYVGRFLNTEKVFVLLAGAGLAPELLRPAGARPWVIILVIVLAAIGYHAIWHYRRNPRSVRSLLWMLDGFSLGLAGLLPLIMLLLASTWASNFALYERYWPAYMSVAAIVFVYMAFIRGSTYRNAMEQQIAALRGGAERTQLSAQEFYDDVLMTEPGAKSAMRDWGPGRFQAIIGPFVVGFIVLGATNGRDGVLFGAFVLVMIVGVPLLLAAVVRRRISVIRALGSRDITLVPDMYS